MRWMLIRFTHWRDAAAPNAPDWATHPKVGTTGFMRIDEWGAVTLVDERAAPLPEGVQVCYEITDAASTGPTWPSEQLALGNGTALEQRRIARLAKTEPIKALLKKEGLQ